MRRTVLHHGKGTITTMAKKPLDHLDQTFQLLGYHAIANMVALTTLARCLVNAGALPEGLFETALRDTIEHEGADRERPDYKLLAQLLEELERIDGDEPPLN